MSIALSLERAGRTSPPMVFTARDVPSIRPPRAGTQTRRRAFSVTRVKRHSGEIRHAARGK